MAPRRLSFVAVAAVLGAAIALWLSAGTLTVANVDPGAPRIALLASPAWLALVTASSLVLVCVIVTIVAAGRAAAIGKPWDRNARDLLIVALAVIGFLASSGERRTKNLFTFAPIIEVAIIFAAIFATMAPVLEILNAWAARPDFALKTPAHFFWASGALSSVLDNAPTYLAFAASAAGLHHVAPHGAYIGTLALDPSTAKLLAAISTGSVFMGANTYIGNAPNFMVRAIAEENGIKMPSFFGYMAYSLGILLPLFVLVSVVFFR